MQKRYNNDPDLWATHRGERMLSWGFNTLGEYTCQRGLPVGTWGGKSGNAVKLPFILFLSVSADSIYHPSDIGRRTDQADHQRNPIVHLQLCPQLLWRGSDGRFR